MQSLIGRNLLGHNQTVLSRTSCKQVRFLHSFLDMKWNIKNLIQSIKQYWNEKHAKTTEYPKNYLGTHVAKSEVTGGSPEDMNEMPPSSI